jgi:hypothetical protein
MSDIKKLPPTDREYASGTLTAGFLCPDCSAWVHDTEIHDKFHDGRIEETKKIIDETMRDMARKIREGVRLSDQHA